MIVPRFSRLGLELKAPAPVLKAGATPFVTAATSSLIFDAINAGKLANDPTSVRGKPVEGQPAPSSPATTQPALSASAPGKLGTGAKVGIGIAGVAVAAGLAYALTRKPARRRNPRKTKKAHKRRRSA